MQKLLKVLGLTLLLLVFAVTAFGQTETGQITGGVTDASGAVVNNAKVTVTKTDTGYTRAENVSSSGQFVFSNLPSGPYQIKVEAAGFGAFVEKIDVAVGSRNNIEAKLKVAAAGAVVEVSEQAAGVEVDTQSQTIGATITPSQIENLPSLTRNAYDFVLTAGNVSDGDTGGRGVAGVAMNGGRAASTDVMMDGADNVDLYTAQVGQQVPQDSVQEYTVLTSGFTAEYGRASGGVVNVATKTGTNGFHGSVYEFNRISALAANTYDANAYGLKKAPFTRNQFGYSIGGPIIKNKLFFFSNTEWTRIRSSQNETAWVPDSAFLAQTGANTTAFFNKYGTIDKGVTVLNTMTAGDIAAGNGAWSTASLAKYSPNFSTLAATNPALKVFDKVNYVVPYDSGAGSPENQYNMVNRVDYNITDKTTLWGRYALDNIAFFPGTVANSPYAGYNTGENQRNQGVLVNLTHVFSPNLLNQLKFSYNRLYDAQPLSTQPASPSLYLAASVPSWGDATPAMPGYLPYSQANAIPFGGPQNLYQIKDQVALTRGKHNTSFGFEYLHTRDNRTFGAYEEGIADLAKNSAGALDALLAGTIYSYQVAIDPKGLYPCPIDPSTGAVLTTCTSGTLTLPAGLPAFNRHNHYNDFAAYGQDAWKLSKRLTLNLGLRWEFYGVQHNTDPSLDSNFYYPGKLSPAAVRAGYVATVPNSPIHKLWNNSLKNYGPRIGFAYDVTGDGKTSLRGGYGISYERNFGNVTFNVIQNPPNYAVVQLTNPAGFALPTEDAGPFSGTGSKVLGPVTLRGVDPNIKTAYASNWSLALERQIMPQTLVALEYTGSRGVHQYSITNVNRYFGGYAYNGDAYPGGNADNAFYTVRSNYQYGNINFRGSNGDSSYHALNVRAQSSNFMKYGLQFTFNYTWSHSIDDLSTTFTESQSAEAQGSLGFLDWMHPGYDRASSDYDVRHRIAVSAVYKPPFFKGSSNKVLEYAAGGWSFAPWVVWHTGSPFTLYDCGYAYGICARQLNGSEGTKLSLTPTGNGNEFNYYQPAAYTPYTASINGVVFGGGATDVPSVSNGKIGYPSNMVGRNSVRTPNVMAATNLGIYKDFKLYREVALQFRAEAYNLFNHSNTYVNYGTTDTEYGSNITANKGNNPYSGIPDRRNLQLALRLSF